MLPNLWLLTIIVIALATGLVARRKSSVPGAISLSVLSLSIAIWSLAYLLHANLSTAALDRVVLAAAFLCSTLAASAQLTFSLSYTNRQSWITRYTLVLLCGMPVLTQILFWIEPWRNIFFAGQPAPGAFFFSGVWARINMIYIYNLVGASVLLLMDTFIRKPRPLLIRSGTILAGATLPMLAQLLSLIGYPVLQNMLFPLLGFSLAALGFSYGLFNQSLIETIPVTREAVVEGMNDGWIVLNPQNIIVDINPAAERIIGQSREKIYGLPIHDVLSDLPNLGKTFDEIRELDMKRSLKSQDGWRYLNVRISSLTDPKKNLFGRLIVWRDITERRLAEDARQRARDEMFVLLNAISAASHSVSLEEFLSESIYQIIYPFRSQIVGIFLLDERDKKTEAPRLILASHFGFPPDAIDQMPEMLVSSPLFEWVFKTKQPMLIDNVNDDLRVPLAMREIDFSCLLVLPLIPRAGEDSKIIGCICMARKEKPNFTQDEVVRMTTISDQIATLIDSDRRRKLAIALSERQRLQRDLHDSVSQKLYGLVTLTEAAQAALEAGSTVDPAHVLSRIGENARQAVKEMRLFLYQMQPIDVAKESLVSILHYRLAAVEGRADIKARLLADEEITLSKDKEIALYFIAQEALNNILRHAHAKTVTVKLKQGRRNVILEIVDDGHGFDPKKVERGGLGLQNMKERALQIDGKVKILSKAGAGTKIVVTVGRDKSNPSSRNRRRE